MTTPSSVAANFLGGEQSEARSVAHPSAPPIRVRAMGFPFRESSIPRHWFHNNAHITQLGNALQLLFPAGERFFIRSVKHYESQIQDPELRARIRGFYGQEGRHGHEHERFFRVLEEQGYEIATFLSWYEELAYAKLEPSVPPSLRLSITAALEHFTAMMGHNALSEDFLNGAHPVIQDLMRWHAAEEIEHKSVAFDVFQEVDGRYLVRIAGLALALIALTRFWAAATKHLLAEEARMGTDMEASERAMKTTPRFIQEGKRRRRMFRDAILAYIKPSFHPSDEDDYGMARDYLTKIGRLDA